ncbi:hypothetical protein EVAR_73000_1, partial [Eumeta japonica]
SFPQESGEAWSNPVTAVGLLSSENSAANTRPRLF